MFRITLIFIVLAAWYLFWPRYDLFEKDGTFSEHYSVRERGFWSVKDCNAVGEDLSNPYKCLKTSSWQGLVGKQIDYNEERQY